MSAAVLRAPPAKPKPEMPIEWAPWVVRRSVNPAFGRTYTVQREAQGQVEHLLDKKGWPRRFHGAGAAERARLQLAGGAK